MYSINFLSTYFIQKGSLLPSQVSKSSLAQSVGVTEGGARDAHATALAVLGRVGVTAFFSLR